MLLQELFSVTSAQQPRVFSLQKIVEVADFNMDKRPRVVWARVWDVLSKFFARVGCHPNHGIAMFAIDSLKQLSLKFLEKVRRLRHSVCARGVAATSLVLFACDSTLLLLDSRP
jgi:Sec7-like guanine-nucleotide exchange factor